MGWCWGVELHRAAPLGLQSWVLEAILMILGDASAMLPLLYMSLLYPNVFYRTLLVSIHPIVGGETLGASPNSLTVPPLSLWCLLH
jgi:hypothetical protein